MAEVCQSGIDKYGIPQWCVEHTMDDPLFWAQFVAELFVLIVLMLLLSKVFNIIKKWKKRILKKHREGLSKREDPF